VANKRISLFVMTALAAALAIFVATGTADEHSGTLKMNRAKSKYSPGPALKNLTDQSGRDCNSRRIIPAGSRIRYDPARGCGCERDPVPAHASGVLI